jgi:phosphoglycerate dehydrogenase-like enzyme
MTLETSAAVVVTFPAPPALHSAVEQLLANLGSLAFLSEFDNTAREGALRSADAVMAWNPSRELGDLPADALGSVRFLQLLSAGADHVRFHELPDSLVVASNVGAFAEPMAEHIVAMTLALAKQLPQKHAELAGGEFQQRPPTRRIKGMVVGILGLGGIGKATAGLMRGLGMRIHAVNTSGRTDEDVEFIGTLDDLDTLLRGSDVVVISLPLTKATRGLLGRRELEVMKPDGILINPARGAIVEQEALYQHLRANPEFTAGIDAWWTEPFGGREFRLDFPFLELPNVLGSPHNSAIVPGIEEAAARRAAENVARFLRGESVTGVVQREDYKEQEGPPCL